MILIKTKEDVDKIKVGEFCFIQCPKTGIIHKMTPSISSTRRKFYYITQGGGRGFVTNDAYPRDGYGQGYENGRYHFAKAKLKELIENKAFTVTR